MVNLMTDIAIAIRFCIPRGLDNTCSRLHISVIESFEDVLRARHRTRTTRIDGTRIAACTVYVCRFREFICMMNTDIFIRIQPYE